MITNTNYVNIIIKINYCIILESNEVLNTSIVVNDMIKKHKQPLLIILFCLITATIVLLITSKSSPLYPFNDWVDANAFFTMGKGMFNGKILYKDLFEQKGPLLYLIYGIGYLLSNTTFLGVFCLEIISFTVFLYYMYKCITIFLKQKEYLIIIPLLALLITTSKAFSHGGSAEEFSLSFFAFSLYSFLKYLNMKHITNKTFFINGLLAGCVFMIKYTLLGFWLGWVICLTYPFLKQKDYKKYILSISCFLGGMLIPTGLWCVYFAVNNGLMEFINAYFIVNIFSYTLKTSFISRIVIIAKSFFTKLVVNGLIITFLFIAFPLVFKAIKFDIYSKVSLIFIVFCSIIGIFIGGTAYNYYFLFLLPFIIFSLITIIKFISPWLNNFFSHRYSYFIYAVFYILTLQLAFSMSGNTYFMMTKKEDLVQYKFAEIIKTISNATLLNYGTLDWGLYTTTNLVPNVRYFEQQNLNRRRYPQNVDEQRRYIEQKMVSFVIMPTRKNEENIKQMIPKLYENYTLVMHDTQKFEDNTYNVYLYKIKP